MSDAIATMISLILPPNCQCSKNEEIYTITCADYGTARGVWERRFQAIYPLLNPGNILEVIGDEFHAKSYPKP